MRTIKVKPWGEGQGDHVVINEDDFDKKFHKKFTDKQLAAMDKPDAEQSDAEEE